MKRNIDFNHALIRPVLFFILFLNTMLLWSIGAQEVNPYKLVAEITYVEGNELSIINSDRNRDITYQSDMGQIDVYEGASIVTGANTFVELSLKNSNTLIKVAENTHFRLQHIEMDAGESLFHVITGSIRAKIDKLSSKHKFYFVGGNSVSGIRGTDFGITVKGEELSSSEAHVYCFEGEIEVVPLEYLTILPSQALKPTVVTAQEMVTIPAENAPESLSKTAIPSTITSFWQAHPFKTDMKGKDKSTGFERRGKTPLLIAGGTMLGLGAVAETVGVILLATLSSDQDAELFTQQRTIGTATTIGGGTLLISSAVTLLIGLLTGE